MLARLRVLMLVVTLIASQLVFSPASAQEDAVQVVEKTTCLSALGFASLDELKAQLTLEAKRAAVNELFGELITASTQVEDYVVTIDQLAATSIGFVRVTGDASYVNGDNLAEVCVTIRAFVTEDDLAQFEPIPLTKRLCQAIPDLSADALANFTKQEAIIQALYDYDATLAGKDREALLNLMGKITYTESGFLEGTTTYCVRLEGYVTPIEVLAFTSTGGVATGEAAEPASQATSGGVQSPQTLEDRFSAECAETIEFGQMLNCSLEEDGQKNSHTFDAEAGDRILFTLVRTRGDIEPGLTLYDENGDIVPGPRYGDCVSIGLPGTQVTCTLERSGQYSILVYSNVADTTGAYRLDIQRLNAPGRSSSLEFGAPIHSEIGANYQHDYYTFTADAGDRILITQVRTSGDIEPGFTVYGKDGTVTPGPRYGDCAGSDRLVAEAICILERSGQFVVLAYTGALDTTGGYRLDVQKLNNPEHAVALNFDESVSGDIAANNEYDFYTFLGEAGNKISVRLERTAGDIAPAFVVLGKDGTTAPGPRYGDCAGDEQELAEVTCELERSGQYTIWVRSSSYDTAGSYLLELSTQ